MTFSLARCQTDLCGRATYCGWKVFIQHQFLMTALSEQILDNCDRIDFVTLKGMAKNARSDFSAILKIRHG